MKRNSMLTKIIAVLLCALMVAAWLPKTSAAASDYESGMDRDYGAHAGNAIDLVIGTNADAGLADTYYAYTPAEDGTLTLTAEDGTTFTVDGVAYTEAVAVTAGTKYIIVATNVALAHSFTAAFEVASSAIELVIGTNANEGAEVTYTYTATADGRVKLSAADGTTFTVDGAACYNTFAVVTGTTYTIVASNANGAHSFEAKYLAYNEYLYMDSQTFRLADSIQASLRINYRINANATNAKYKFERAWLEVAYVDYNGNIVVDVLDETDMAPYWTFYYNLNPAELATIRNITVHGIKDGVEYVGEHTGDYDYSNWAAKSLLLNLFDASYANKDTDTVANLRCVLLADMLMYAEQTQYALNINADNPVTNGVSADYLAMATQVTPTINASLTTSSSGTNTLRNVNLRLADKIQLSLQFYLPSGADATTYSVKVGDTVYTSESFSVSGRWVTLYAGIIAKDVRVPVTVELLKDGAVMNTTAYSVSVEGACTKLVSAGSYVDLCESIMKYGDAANAYFTAVLG
ncbi:MAG: hypothetical protein J6C41_03140 [Oscillospiraceae bacterium]|nr:hypothetical protein [Oscillospiraceae bacterium]